MATIEEFLRAFCGALAAGRMYPVTHPQFMSVRDTAYDHLQVVLREKGELIIGLVEGEIVYENKVLFRLSDMLGLLIEFAKKKEVEKIYFYPEIRKDELTKFLSFLLSSEEISGSAEDYLLLIGINSIKVSRLTTPEEEKKKEDENQLPPYENTLNDLSQFFDQFFGGEGDASNIARDLKLIVLNIVDKLMGKHQEFLSATPLKGYDPNIIRCFNVALVATHFASKIGFPQEDIVDVGIASLLSDIGRISMLQQDSLQSGQRHSDNYFPMQYGIRGAGMLLEYEQNLGVLPIIVAFERSLKYDSTQNEPTLAYFQKQHTVSLMVSICDFYSTKMQSGKEEAAPSQEFLGHVMRTEKSGWFHPQLLERFFKTINL